ncbi:hypothetical protein [Natrinema gari]|nr:hypothetical protein [Natrinema gari]
MKKKMLLSVLLAVFAVGMAGSVGIVVAELDLGNGNVYDIAEFAIPIAFLTLAAGILIAGRSPDSIRNWELVLVAVPMLVLGGLFLEVEFMVRLIEDEHPWTGLIALGTGFFAYWMMAFGGPRSTSGGGGS